MRGVLMVLALAPTLAFAEGSCERLVARGVADCHLRLSLDAQELLLQEQVRLSPEQKAIAARERPLHELDPTPEQVGQIQEYCRSHGEIRRRIGIQQGLCSDEP